MKSDTPNSLEVNLSRDSIDQQLKRIFLDPHFTNAEILRKFLSFIVEETMTGRANCLKEYTIGLKVLNKPANFKPQDNGIVRIHAGRLRRALHNYYNTIGATDPIKIFIPKGRYVPEFIDTLDKTTGKESNNTNISNSSPDNEVKKQEAFAIIPFQHFHDDSLENSLIDGLGLQLSNALMRFENYSVVAYYTMRDLWKKTNNISKAASLADAKYVITGSIQVLQNIARVHVQVIDLYGYKQLLSCMYEGEFYSQNIFKLQDDIVQFIMLEIIKSGKIVIGNKAPRRSMIAVA
jgi:TolB-like protein